MVESPCLQSSILLQRRHSSGIDSFLGSVRRYPNSCRHTCGACTLNSGWSSLSWMGSSAAGSGLASSVGVSVSVSLALLRFLLTCLE